MRFPVIIFQLISVVLALPALSWAQGQLYDQKAPEPEIQLENFIVAEGFKVELVASEKDGIIKPVEINFDDAGRLWTQTARMFPLDPIAGLDPEELLSLQKDQQKFDTHPNVVKLKKMFRGEISGEDQILILDGFMQNKDLKVRVWKDGLTSPMSILPYKSGALVAQGSEIFFLDDTNRDGMADQRISLFTGFGFTDTHAMPHGLVKGPDNWIHFSHGGLNRGMVKSLISGDSIRMEYSKIARFSNDGTKIQILNSGLNNIWGYSLRNDGLWYGSEANDLGYSVTPMQPGMGFPGIGNDRLRSYQPLMPSLHSFRVGGTGLSGLAFSDGVTASFPEKFKDVAFLANPVTGAINLVRINHNPDGTIEAEHLDDLLKSDDEWFRPVDVQFGPDGCLYIADWCHTLVSHNEVDMQEDLRGRELQGRIWRVCAENQEEEGIPNFYELETGELPNHLNSSSQWARRAAWNQISERPIDEIEKIIPVLEEMVQDKSRDVSTRIHALWSLENIGWLGWYDIGVIENLLKDTSPDIRRETIRTLNSFSISASELAQLVKPFINSENAKIRAQTLQTLGGAETGNDEIITLLVSACNPELFGEGLGGPYERRQERFLARMVLEQWPDQLYEFLNKNKAEQFPVENKLWAMLALPKEQQKEIFLRIWDPVLSEDISPSTFLGLMEIAEHPDVFKALQVTLNKSDKQRDYLIQALKNHTGIHSSAIGELFREYVETILQNNEESVVRLAVEAMVKFDIEVEAQELIRFLRQSEDLTVNNDILKILAKKPYENKPVFLSVAKDESVNFAIRSAALNILTKVDLALGESALSTLWNQSSIEQKKQITEIFSFSKNGGEIILRGIESGWLNERIIDLPMAERIHYLMKESRSEILLNKKKGVENVNAVEKEVDESLMALKTNVGVASRGKEIFEKTCLSCHRVDQRGKDIAPSLDGSAYRSTRALLTAIIEPDAAVESGYYLYRVSRKDDSVVEGLLYHKNEKGTTIAFEGGSKLFISKDEIIREGYLFGRSFMPSGLMDDYSDQQLADLIVYIKTLK